MLAPRHSIDAYAKHSQLNCCFYYPFFFLKYFSAVSPTTLSKSLMFSVSSMSLLGYGVCVYCYACELLPSFILRFSFPYQPSGPTLPIHQQVLNTRAVMSSRTSSSERELSSTRKCPLCCFELSSTLSFFFLFSSSFPFHLFGINPHTQYTNHTFPTATGRLFPSSTSRESLSVDAISSTPCSKRESSSLFSKRLVPSRSRPSKVI